MSVQFTKPSVGTFNQLVSQNSASLKIVRMYVHNVLKVDSAYGVLETFLAGKHKAQHCELQVAGTFNARKSHLHTANQGFLCTQAKSTPPRRVQVLGYPYLR